MNIIGLKIVLTLFTVCGIVINANSNSYLTMPKYIVSAILGCCSTGLWFWV